MPFAPDGEGTAVTQLEARFAETQARLHPRRRQMLRAILDHPEETYFLSSRGLGKRFGVDAATVVRTIQALGYERFADFAADLRRHFVTRITPYTLLRSATREKQPVADRIQHNVGKDIDNLHLLQTQLDTAQIMEVARLVHRARQILVIGVDLAASLSYFLAYGLATAGFRAEAPIGSAGILYHKVKGLDAKDLLIALSFGRCLRETVEAVRQARQQGVPTFGVTNSDTTPIARYCDGYVIAPITSAVFTGSYVAPMAVLNTIIAACSHLQPQRTLARLRENEKEYTSGARWYQKKRPDERVVANGRPQPNGRRYGE
jgi:DNA-binding MurR/RpiR family transcriptional regulator